MVQFNEKIKDERKITTISFDLSASFVSPSICLYNAASNRTAMIKDGHEPNFQPWNNNFNYRHIQVLIRVRYPNLVHSTKIHNLFNTDLQIDF